MKLKLLGLSVALACFSVQSHALGRLADVAVVDRGTGNLLPAHYYRGEYWVAGTPGARYAVLVRNRSGERIMAVTSVDGVNVLNGETASWGQTGYVLSPFLHYQITGWRKSNHEVAAFEFSDASDSYAGRTGRPTHVGVIGVALFREMRPEPISGAAVAPQRNNPFDWLRRAQPDAASVPPAPPAPLPPLSPATALSSAPAATPARSAGMASGLAERPIESPVTQMSDSSRSELQARLAQPLSTPKLGTAHGRSETSTVSITSFARLQEQPNEVIRIRYDSRENLVALGVIRVPALPAPGPAANPFPLSDQANYVPDPPPRRY